MFTRVNRYNSPPTVTSVKEWSNPVLCKNERVSVSKPAVIERSHIRNSHQWGSKRDGRHRIQLWRQSTENDVLICRGLNHRIPLVVGTPSTYVQSVHPTSRRPESTSPLTRPTPGPTTHWPVTEGEVCRPFGPERVGRVVRSFSCSFRKF